MRFVPIKTRGVQTEDRLPDRAIGVAQWCTALVASVADPKTFRSGRNFSAWIGLVPKQHSSGGRDRLGSISKQGDRYLRSLFVAGALAVIRYAKIHGAEYRPWVAAYCWARRPTKVAAIALANKLHRDNSLRCGFWSLSGQSRDFGQPNALKIYGFTA